MILSCSMCVCVFFTSCQFVKVSFFFSIPKFEDTVLSLSHHWQRYKIDCQKIVKLYRKKKKKLINQEKSDIVFIYLPLISETSCFIKEVSSRHEAISHDILETHCSAPDYCGLAQNYIQTLTRSSGVDLTPGSSDATPRLGHRRGVSVTHIK